MEFVPINIDELQSEYESGKSLRQLAIQYNTSKLTIKRKLEKNGVKILSSSERARTKQHKQLSAKRYDLDDKKILDFFDNGKSVNEISQIVGASTFAVNRCLRSHGKEIKSRSGEEITQKFKEIYNVVRPEWSTITNLHDLYNNQQLSIRDIAKKYNYDEEAIRTMMVKFGIDRRTPQESTFIHNKREGFVSSLEKIIIDILGDFQIKNEKVYLGGFGYDLFIDKCEIDSNKHVLIEVNGNFIHVAEEVKTRDAEKFDYWQYNLADEYEFHVLWEHDFAVYGSIFNSLNTILGGKLNNIEISIDDLQFEPVKSHVSRNFYDKYHYLDNARGGTHIAAKLDDKIVACGSFSNITRMESAQRLDIDHKYMRELSRFCISPLYHNKNLASFVLSKFIKMMKQQLPQVKKLITFADQTMGHLGTIYKATNWKYDGETKESYYYEKDGKTWHKRTIWKHAKQIHMTESEFIQFFGITKINTLKKHRYLFDL